MSSLPVFLFNYPLSSLPVFLYHFFNSTAWLTVAALLSKLKMKQQKASCFDGSLWLLQLVAESQRELLSWNVSLSFLFISAKFRRQDEIEEEEEYAPSAERKEISWKDFLNEE